MGGTRIASPKLLASLKEDVCRAKLATGNDMLLDYNPDFSSLGHDPGRFWLNVRADHERDWNICDNIHG
jgi:hypothetical protein